MICLFKYSNTMMGSQTSVRSGNANTLAYQIFFRDGLKMLLDMGFNAKKDSVKKQFEYAETVYQAQCNSTITLEMIKNYRFSTDYGGFECLFAAETADEIDELCDIILSITEKKHQNSIIIAKEIARLIELLQQAKTDDSEELDDKINAVHHVL